MSKAAETRIPCSKDTRRLVKSLKRGDESYNSVLQKMAEQYNPEEAAQPARGKD